MPDNGPYEPVGAWLDITYDTVKDLVTEHHIVGFVTIPCCGADMNLLLGNGRVISYWAPTDASPEDWWLWHETTEEAPE
jgi:hypothetical protein